ncbi:hypothetical protein AHAS_Ahas19G0373300 [Arachis hypogaea]
MVETNSKLRFYIDGRPIREFKNLEGVGVPYPNYQPMKLYSSLSNADDWATRGGLVKIDWSQAPFTASFKNLKANGCVWSNGVSSCNLSSSNSSDNNNSWLSQQLDSNGQRKLKWLQKNYMIYNYCSDINRFPRASLLNARSEPPDFKFRVPQFILQFKLFV